MSGSAAGAGLSAAAASFGRGAAAIFADQRPTRSRHRWRDARGTAALAGSGTRGVAVLGTQLIEFGSQPSQFGLLAAS